MPERRVLLRDSMVPGSPILGRVGPGSKEIRPSIKIYSLTREKDAVGFLRNELTGGIKGPGAKAKSIRKKGRGIKKSQSCKATIKITRGETGSG